MTETNLKERENKQDSDLVSLTNIVDQLLPNEDTKIKNRLRIKIYNLSRSKNWSWVTIKRRRYYKPEIAQAILTATKDYAKTLKEQKSQKTKTTENTKEKDQNPDKSFMRVKDILAEATQKDKLSKKVTKKLRKRISYIAKINFMKPVKRGIYNIEDGRQIVLELATYYQQLKTNLDLSEKISKTRKEKSQLPLHKIKEKHSRMRSKNKHNSRDPHLSKKIADLESSYNNLLKNYAELQLKYEKVLNEKNNLINEKANQLLNQSHNLKAVLNTILNKM